ncbi:TetR/AcrR family transcriptional regulator [Myxococcota bacterium]|nr:TetR/AcrR family transcriptional regulator [Myxococcota bacterium]MCZ7617160.1 TetR/AcrR family transcriptional regulator [Myxococcota bacterium]
MARAHDTRARILEVAEQEFATAGFAGAHLQKIAEQVGVQKTALYYYFDSKAALYTTVLEAMLEALERALQTAIEAPEPPERRLELLVTRFNDLLATHPTYARILFRVFVDQPNVDASRVLPIVERVIGRLFRFYREGIDSGAFRRLSSRHFFQHLLGMTVFHYAAPFFSTRVLGVEDIFADDAVLWRRDEVIALLRDGVLRRDDKPDRIRSGEKR